MALSYRRKVRLALLAALSDATTGFNAQLATVWAGYGLAGSPFTVDFTGVDGSFVQSNIDPESLDMLEKEELIKFPALVLYTHTVRDTPEPSAYRFAGDVTACIELVYRVRTGMEGANTEDVLEAFEAAIFAVLNNPALPWPSLGVRFAKQTDARPSSIIPLSDGWHHVTRIETLFGVIDA